MQPITADQLASLPDERVGRVQFWVSRPITLTREVAAGETYTAANGARLTAETPRVLRLDLDGNTPGLALYRTDAAVFVSFEVEAEGIRDPFLAFFPDPETGRYYLAADWEAAEVLYAKQAYTVTPESAAAMLLVEADVLPEAAPAADDDGVNASAGGAGGESGVAEERREMSGRAVE